MAPREFVAGRSELLAVGFSKHRLRSWRRSGRLITPFRGVYSYGRDIQTRNAALRAGLLVAGPRAALTGTVALEVWGAIKIPAAIPTQIELATPVDRGGTHLGISPALRHTRVKVVQRRFDALDIRRVGGLEVLAPALALLEFASGASERNVRFAFLELCRLGHFGQGDLAYCIEKSAGRRGVSKVRPLMGLWVPELERIRSVLEGLFILSWVERDLMMPEVNVKVFGKEVDCYWRQEGVVLELDGAAFHSDPISKKTDFEKQRHLESMGLRVIRITWREFTDDPARAVETITNEVALAKGRAGSWRQQ